VSRLEPAPLQLATRQSWYPWLVVGITCIGGFIGQLDASIVQLALPTFEREFNANLDAVSWVAIAYLLAFAATLPIFARLSETKGRKLLYLAGYAIFTLASALCSMAPNLRLLIAFRVLQGIGGAGGGHQRRPCDWRFAPRETGLALHLLSVGSVRAGRRRSRLARIAANGAVYVQQAIRLVGRVLAHSCADLDRPHAE
jgi:MFS family permease